MLQNLFPIGFHACLAFVIPKIQANSGKNENPYDFSARFPEGRPSHSAGALERWGVGVPGRRSAG